MKVLIQYNENNYRYFESVRDIQIYYDRIEFGSEYIRFNEILSVDFIADSRREERRIKKFITFVHHKINVTPHKRSVEWCKDHLIETLWVMKWIKKVELPIDPFWYHSVPTKSIMKFFATPKNHMYKEMDFNAYMESDMIDPCKFMGCGAEFGRDYCKNKNCDYSQGSWTTHKCGNEELEAFYKMFELINRPRPYKEVRKLKELLYIKYMEEEYNG